MRWAESLPPPTFDADRRLRETRPSRLIPHRVRANMIDLTSIPRLARGLGRLVEIARTLTKYGLADALARLDYRFVQRWTRGTELDRLSTETREARIRLALTDLGTTFIKFGQVLSTRRDLVGPALGGELAQAPVARPRRPVRGHAGDDRSRTRPAARGAVRDVRTRTDGVRVDRAGPPGDAARRPARRGEGSAPGHRPAHRRRPRHPGRTGRARRAVPAGVPRRTGRSRWSRSSSER